MTAYCTCFKLFLGVLSVCVAFQSVAVTAGPEHYFSRFNPRDQPDGGALILVDGDTIAFDTDAGSYSTNGAAPIAIGKLETSTSGNVVVRMFNFKSISLPSGVSVTVTGNLGLVLGSKSTISLGTTIDVSGTAGSNTEAGSGGPGAEGGERGVSTNSTTLGARGTGGADGNGTLQEQTDGVGYGGGGKSQDSQDIGNGGGYGGAGGGDSGHTGAVYGDDQLTDLYGGSGGGGSASNDDGIQDGAGGGGGGAIELTALQSITVLGTGQLIAKGGGGTGAYGSGGGSGGAILLNAPSVTINSGAKLDVSGSSGGDGNPDGGAGGGGRIAIYAAVGGLTNNGTLEVKAGHPLGAGSAVSGTTYTGIYYIRPTPATVIIVK